jgi:hypothetical protein
MDKELIELKQKLTKTEWRLIKQSLQKDRCEQMARRRMYLDFWFAGDKMIEYWEAVGRRDIEWFENNCRCFFSDYQEECPSCVMLRLITENKY